MIQALRSPPKRCSINGLNLRELFISITLLLLCSIAPRQAAQACAPRFGSWSDNAHIWQMFFRQSNGIDRSSSSDDNQDNDDQRVQWTTHDWLTQHNYSYELHNVTTADGYELQMQRLPRVGSRPVLLLHGLFTSSLSWVLMGPQNSLAFQLYNQDYDVWLANFRGSMPFGRGHTELNASSSKDFWNYSFHEHGVYDLPAFIDYVLAQTTTFNEVLLIAHSQGFNAVLVLCALQPIYNERILFIQALAPIVRLKNYTNLDNTNVRRIMKFIKTKEKSQVSELFPAGSLKRICLKGSSEERTNCREYMKLITGAQQYQKTLNPFIYGQLLQGGSAKEVTHLQQIWKSGDFISYDYGPDENRKYYNSVEAISYNLSRISVPIVLFFGETDTLATPEGVHSIYSKLSMNSIMGVYRIAAAKFNHLDFICSPLIKALVNDRLIELMNSFLDGKLRYVIE